MSELYINDHFNNGTGTTSYFITAESSSSSEYILTDVKTTDYTAVSGDHILFDLSTSLVDINCVLPSTPSSGDKIKITLVAESATYNVVFDRNTNSFMENDDTRFYDLCLTGDTITLLYVNSKWIVIDKQFKKHYGQLDEFTSSVNTTTAVTVWRYIDYQIGMSGSLTTGFTIRRKGIYRFSFRGALFATTTYSHNLSLIKNGGYVLYTYDANQYSSYGGNCGFTHLLEVSKDDVMNIKLTISSGTADLSRLNYPNFNAEEL